MAADETQHAISESTDVVVIGAGPVGLTVACALQHHGVPFRIVEQRMEPNPHSKANNLWARPQELLAGIGVRDRLAERAYTVPDVRVLLDGKPLDRVPVSHVDSPYADALYTGQDVIEATLVEVLEQAGNRVERGRAVRGLEQDADGVTVTVSDAEDPEGAVEQLRCRYLVGADGTEGTVRKALGLEFEPEHLEGRATRQIDAKLSWRRSTEPDQLWFFLYEHGFAGVMPVWGGRHRLFFLEDDEEVADRDPTLDEMQARAREVIGDPTITLSDPTWFSHGRFQHGVALAYAQGRVLLAGDAGHRTLPIGGQGMNAGMTDAVGLAWRLAMVLDGAAGDLVLGSYASERQGAHADLDEDQAKGFEQLMYRGRLGDAALKAAGRAVPNLGSRVFGGDDLQQLTVAYRDSLLSEDHLHSHVLPQRAAAQAGDRAPDARVAAQDGETTTLFERLRAPGDPTWSWTLLAFDGGEEDALRQLDAACAAVRRWRWVRPQLVVAAPAASVDQAGTPVLFDLDEAAHAAYGLRGHPALVLVRPDGHIALRAAADGAERLTAYCGRLSAA